MNWIEKLPQQDDVVKFKFPDWSNLGTKIGIVLGITNGKFKIDFGDVVKYLDITATYLVLSK